MTKPTIDLAELRKVRLHIFVSAEDSDAEAIFDGIGSMADWIEAALPKLERYLQQSADDLIHGDVDEDELRSLIAQVQRVKP